MFVSGREIPTLTSDTVLIWPDMARFDARFTRLNPLIPSPSCDLPIHYTKGLGQLSQYLN